MKRWLRAQPAAGSIAELQERIDKFVLTYIQHRPHSSLRKRAPAVFYNLPPKATPQDASAGIHIRVRTDTIDNHGKVSLRRAGKMHHIGLGRRHKGQPVSSSPISTSASCTAPPANSSPKRPSTPPAATKHNPENEKPPNPTAGSGVRDVLQHHRVEGATCPVTPPLWVTTTWSVAAASVSVNEPGKGSCYVAACCAGRGSTRSVRQGETLQVLGTRKSTQRARLLDYRRGALAVGLAALTAIVVQPSALATQRGGFPFREGFAGTQVKPARWNTSVETSGTRWCGPPNNTDAGAYCDPGLPAPYGTVTVGGGTAMFDAPSDSPAFPYVFTGPASYRSAFPRTGPFDLTIRLRYDYVGASGTGFEVHNVLNGDPANDDSGSGIPPGVDSFGVWADTNFYQGIAVYALRDGQLFVDALLSPNVFNTVKWAFDGRGIERVYVNGALVAGPLTYTVSPNVMWLGNAALAGGDWSAFTVDRVDVTRPIHAER
jgi:hypothetical protein